MIWKSANSLTQLKNATTFAGINKLRSGMLEINWSPFIIPQSRASDVDSKMFIAKVAIDAVVTVF